MNDQTGSAAPGDFPMIGTTRVTIDPIHMTRLAHKFLGGLAYPDTGDHVGAICGAPLMLRQMFAVMDAIRFLECIKHELEYIGPLPTCPDCRVRFDEAMERQRPLTSVFPLSKP